MTHHRDTRSNTPGAACVTTAASASRNKQAIPSRTRPSPAQTPLGFRCRRRVRPAHGEPTCGLNSLQLTAERAIAVPRPSVAALGQFNSGTGMSLRLLCFRSTLRHLRKEPFQMKRQREKCNLPCLLFAPANKHTQTLPATERFNPKPEGENTSWSSTSLSGCLNRNSRCSQISNWKGYNRLSTESNTQGRHETFCFFPG